MKNTGALSLARNLITHQAVFNAFRILYPKINNNKELGL